MQEKTAKAVSAALKADATEERALASARYFKTGTGQYGEGDIFIGLTVPQVRSIVRAFKELPMPETEKLLRSPIHEERLTALLILVSQFEHSKKSSLQKEIVDLYLKNTPFINNWDLVDTSAPYILGPYLWKRPKALLTKLARSKSLWERRIAMLSTFYFIKQRDCREALQIAELLLSDSHDLMHKAVGWMLREIGSKCGREILKNFLSKHYKQLPRTTLRYAIEHFPEADRKAWLKGPSIEEKLKGYPQTLRQ